MTVAVPTDVHSRDDVIRHIIVSFYKCQLIPVYYIPQSVALLYHLYRLWVAAHYVRRYEWLVLDIVAHGVVGREP